MRKWLAVLTLLAARPRARRRRAAGGARAPFTARDLFSLEVATDPQISPDGRQIAYVRRSDDIMTDRFRPAIWLIDTASGQQMPLVAGTGAHCQPRWSPDGKRLAYVSTAEGGQPQLFVRWMDGGESVRITGLPDAPVEHRLVARRPPDRLHHVRARTRAAARPPPQQARRRATGPSRSQIITAVTYRFDGDGLSEARLTSRSSSSPPTAARRAS